MNLGAPSDMESTALKHLLASHSSPLAMRSWHTLVHPPAPTHRSPNAAECFLKFRRIPDHPPIQRGVIDGDASFAHHLLKLPVGNGVGHIPSYPPQDNLLLKVTALAVHSSTSPPQLSNRDNNPTLLRMKLRNRTSSSSLLFSLLLPTTPQEQFNAFLPVLTLPPIDVITAFLYSSL